jgi:ADP-ribose pyrophosphatase
MTFHRISEEIRYHGRIFDVALSTWRSPEGTEFEREVIRHKGAVAVVPVLGDPPDAQVVLVRQFRTPIGRELLEIPAGLLDVDGESLAETAARELEEETGYAAGALEHLVDVVPSPGSVDVVLTVFLATGLRPMAARRPHGDEEHHMTVERVPWGDVPGLLRSGALLDAKTIAGLWAARLRLVGE